MVYGVSADESLDYGKHIVQRVTTAHGLIMTAQWSAGDDWCFRNWFVPIQIGAPDMAFPRMKQQLVLAVAASFLLLLTSMFVEGRPEATASAVAGRSIRRSRPRTAGSGYGLRPCRSTGGRLVDLGAINFITPFSNMRAPAMTLHKNAALRLVDPGDRISAAPVVASCSPAPSHAAPPTATSARHSSTDRRR